MLLLVLIAGIAMLLGTNVLAQTFTEECTGGKFTLKYIEGPVAYYADSDSHPIFGKITCNSYPCYLWHWAVSGNDKVLQTLTAVTIYYENHHDDPISYVGGATSTAAYQCDESRINSWGEGICNGVTVQFNSQQMVEGPGYRDLYITVDKNSWGEGSAAFHSGNTGGKVDSCFAYESPNDPPIGGIKAPGYDLAAYAVRSTESIWETHGKQIKILRNPITGCGYGVQYRVGDSGSWITVLPTEEVPTVGDEPIQEGGPTFGNLGQLCKEFRFTAAGSPGYVWVNLGGTWYKVVY